MKPNAFNYIHYYKKEISIMTTASLLELIGFCSSLPLQFVPKFFSYSNQSNSLLVNTKHSLPSQHFQLNFE